MDTADKPKLKRPAGWKANEGSAFWIKSSAYGQRYMCKECGKDSLGARSNEEYMHKSTCSRHWTRTEEANPNHDGTETEAQREARIEARLT